MAASCLAPTTSQFSSLPLRSPLMSASSYRQQEIWKKKERAYKRIHSENGHSPTAQRDSCRTSALGRLEPERSSPYYTTVPVVPSGSVDSTIRRNVPAPAPAHLGANEPLHGANNQHGCFSPRYCHIHAV